nr:hypothetical protein [Tanacetum cinerariifolium]
MELDLIKDIKETLLTLKKVNIKLNPNKCSFVMEEGKFLGYIVTSESIRANSEKTKAVMNMPSPNSLKQMQRLSGKLTSLKRFSSKAAKRVLPCLDTLKKCSNKKGLHWTTTSEEAFHAMKKLIAELPTLTAPMEDEELMVYLSAANKAVSAILLVERNKRKIPIHYVNRALQDEKINYPPMEKKGSRGTKDRRGPDTYSSFRQKNIWKLYTDGASTDHGSGVGLILLNLEGEEYSYALRLNFTNSNNDAEYEALLAGLRIAAKMKVKKMHTFVDSKLVASQVEGSYEARGEKTKNIDKMSWRWSEASATFK